MDSSEINVTYLLGAGASAKALPLVKGIKKQERGTPEAAVLGLSERFREFVDEFNEPIDPTYKNDIDGIKENLLYFADKAEEFGTIDTYAKFLFNRQDDQYKTLKKALCFFFVIEQVLYRKFDNRILGFLTTIEKRRSLPENVNILTWNYDFQLQIAGVKLGGNFERHEMTSNTSSWHQHGYFTATPSLDFFPSQNEPYNLIHLNGIAGYAYQKERKLSLISNWDGDINVLLRKLNLKDVEHVLNFAWEESKGIQRVQRAVKIAENTDILVVIGYSFPFFNRFVDRQIFKTLKENGKFRKIYFQDPFIDGQFLRTQFQLDEKVDIEHVKKVDSYFIPMEL